MDVVPGCVGLDMVELGSLLALFLRFEIVGGGVGGRERDFNVYCG